MKSRLAMSLHAVSVRRGGKWVLRAVSWRLRAGERWALLGENGAGKTQLLKLLCGDVWPTPLGPRKLRSDGRVYRLGRRQVDLMEAKQRVAFVGAERQDKYARYGWNLRARDLVATGLHRSDLLLQRVTPAEAKRVSDILRICGLQPLASRRFLSLSYGQKRLALLARALAQDPDWLLLDEFYNGLDTRYRRRIDRVLQGAVRRGQSWVATAHRAADVPRGTRSILQLAAGQVRAVKRVRASELKSLAERAHEKPLARVPARAVAQARGVLRVRADERLRAAGSVPPLVEMSRVNVYVDYRPVLRNLDWQLHRGEHWAVFGANGSGKSSFLKLLYGDLSPALGGRIERFGFPAGTPIGEWKRHVGYVSPELQSDYGVNVSVLELVASGRYSSIGLVDPPTPADRRAAQRWLRFFGLQSFGERRPRELSYGELRRALIARAMAADARMLLLDEPLTGLDPTQRAVMKKMLEELMPRSTLIVAVHHPEDLPRGMTHCLRLHNGRAHAIDFHSAT